MFNGLIHADRLRRAPRSIGLAKSKLTCVVANGGCFSGKPTHMRSERECFKRHRGWQRHALA